MQSATGTVTDAFSISQDTVSLVVSLLILGISGATLYLSHIHEGRSSVSLTSQTSRTGSFSRGSTNRIDGAWGGPVYLKLANTSDKGASVSSITNSIVGLRRGDTVTSADDITLNYSGRDDIASGVQLDGNDTRTYRLYFRLEPETDIYPLLRSESILIRHEVSVEDNKGSYTVEYTSESRLPGPRDVGKTWNQHLKQTAEPVDE